MGSGLKVAMIIRERLAAKNRLLVSVKDAGEARLVLEAGVAVLDIKDPAAGSLGRALKSIWDDILSVVRRDQASRKSPIESSPSIPVPLISAALGELLESKPVAIPAGIDIVKIGLAHCGQLTEGSAGWQDRWLAFREETEALSGRPLEWIAVAYFDPSAHAPSLREVADFAIEKDLAGLLLDSHSKTGGTLFDHFPADDLQTLITEVQSQGLSLALAGQLTTTTLAAAKSLNPNLLAVRSAVCREGNRLLEIEMERLHQIGKSVTTESADSK